MTKQPTLLHRLLLAAGLAAASLPAFAQRGDCGPMEGFNKFHEQRADRMQQHQKKLHDALKLTPDQEGAWKKFAESMKVRAGEERGAPEEWAKITAPERAEKMLDFSKRRQERMAEHVVALKGFYAVLTPEQKKTFDEFHAGPRGGRRGPGTPPPQAPAKG